MDKRTSYKKAVISVIFAVIAVFFITDTVRTKVYGRPPVFCVKAVVYDDGISASYYGAGYKIKFDHNVADGSGEYYITLWILPDSISL